MYHVCMKGGVKKHRDRLRYFKPFCIVNVNIVLRILCSVRVCVLLQTPSAKTFWLLPLRDQARSSPDDLNAGRQEECRSGDFTLSASVEARRADSIY